MDCREAEKMVQLYIENKIPPKKLEEFIEHISHCPSCYDELETYYTIYFAMKYLDEDRHSSYNIKEMLDEDLKKRIQYVKRHRRKTHHHRCCSGGFGILADPLYDVFADAGDPAGDE